MYIDEKQKKRLRAALVIRKTSEKRMEKAEAFYRSSAETEGN